MLQKSRHISLLRYHTPDWAAVAAVHSNPAEDILAGILAGIPADSLVGSSLVGVVHTAAPLVNNSLVVEAWSSHCMGFRYYGQHLVEEIGIVPLEVGFVLGMDSRGQRLDKPERDRMVVCPERSLSVSTWVV